ncbi:unnamed protein product [Ectocarpus sp. 13 AM-2016]
MCGVTAANYKLQDLATSAYCTEYLYVPSQQCRYGTHKERFTHTAAVRTKMVFFSLVPRCPPRPRQPRPPRRTSTRTPE